MERLAFTSPESLEAYCEQVRADLGSRGDEQRRLVETALQRLDELASQASAMHSDDLAAEIAARREEGRKLLARLGTLDALGTAHPPDEPENLETGSSTPLSPVPVVEAPLAPATRAEANGHSTFGAFAPNGDTPPQPTAQPLPSADSAPLPELPAFPMPAFAAPFESAAPQIEALWQQPVDLRPEPEASGVAPDASTAETAAADILVAAPEAPSLASAKLEAWGFGTPASVEPVAPAASIPVPRSEKKAESIPAGLNWSWGSESESPAWAELLVEDAPVPVEPLTDSHFGQLPSPAEIANATPTAEAPPAGGETDSAIRPLVLNVKVGEWGSEHPLSKPELLIGRRDLATRCMPDVEVLYDQAVSRRHLRIVKDNGSYVVEDLDSTNGTTLNGRSLRPGHPEMLKAGDELEIGEFTLLKIAAV